MKGFKKVKKAAAGILLLAVLLVTVLPVQAQAAAVTKAKAYKAYAQWLESKEAEEVKYDQFSLVRLDSDKVPELVAKHEGYVRDYCICTFNGKKVVTQSFTEANVVGGMLQSHWYYIPRKGKIAVTSSMGGRTVVEASLLKSGKWKQTFAGASDPESGEWTINEKKVSEAVYNKKLSSAFNMKKAKLFYDLPYVSKAKILKKLK